MKTHNLLYIYCLFYLIGCNQNHKKHKVNYSQENWKKYYENNSNYNGYAYVFFSKERSKFKTLQNVFIIPVLNSQKTFSKSVFDSLLHKKQVVQLYCFLPDIDSIRKYSQQTIFINIKPTNRFFYKSSPYEVSVVKIRYLNFEKMEASNYVDSDLRNYPLNIKDQIIIKRYVKNDSSYIKFYL